MFDIEAKLHMLIDDEKFENLFFTIYYNVVKAWYLHKEATLNYVCVSGEVKLCYMMIEREQII